MLTQEQNIIFQSYFTIAFLTELKNNKFLESDFFKNMKFGSPWIKESLKKISIDNQGALLIALYAMLVIPRQLINEEFEKEYAAIDLFLQQNTVNTKTTYTNDKNSIKFLRHIRNAVAHSRVSFQPNKFVSFSDKGWNKKTQKKESFTTDLPLDKMGSFMQKLQKVHLEYIQRLQRKS